MKKLIYSFVFIFFIIGFKESYSQNPTYQLTAQNFEFTNGCFYWNSIDFDIYLLNTGTTPLEYAAGQYFINFNPAIANGGTLTYEIISSDLPVNLRPRNPSIGAVIDPPGTALRLATNSFPPPGSGYIISNTFPGTKIVRMRLRTTAPSFVEYLNPNFEWRNAPSLVNTQIFAYVNGTSTNITNSNNHIVGNNICQETIPWNCCDRFYHAISINSIIEGFYNPETNRLRRKDTLTIELRYSDNPSNIFSSEKLILDSVNLSSLLVFYIIPFGKPDFYIVVKHFNSIETWSKDPAPYYYDPLYYYDFTASAQNAYGDNVKLIGTKYAIYSGDVNQDKVIDVLDLSSVNNAAYNFDEGRFLPEDLNGDNIVDLLDIQIADNNAFNYVAAITPLN